MAVLNVRESILAVTIIGLAAIALAAFVSLLVQSTSATTVSTTEKVGGGQEASDSASTISTINNNNSNAVLGSLFLTGEDTLTDFNRINETYTEVTYSGNRTIMPPEGITTAMINATETGNLTFKLKSNGITVVEGQSILVD